MRPSKVAMRKWPVAGSMLIPLAGTGARPSRTSSGSKEPRVRASTHW